jgi:threonine dehydrogenase-like Zn-dependent dehydrogenase
MYARNFPGTNIAFEVVGNNSALQLSYDVIRPFGVVSSVGARGSSNVILFTILTAYFIV